MPKLGVRTIIKDPFAFYLNSASTLVNQKDMVLLLYEGNLLMNIALYTTFSHVLNEKLTKILPTSGCVLLIKIWKNNWRYRGKSQLRIEGCLRLGKYRHRYRGKSQLKRKYRHRYRGKSQLRIKGCLRLGKCRHLQPW